MTAFLRRLRTTTLALLVAVNVLGSIGYVCTGPGRRRIPTESVSVYRPGLGQSTERATPVQDLSDGAEKDTGERVYVLIDTRYGMGTLLIPVLNLLLLLVLFLTRKAGRAG